MVRVKRLLINELREDMLGQKLYCNILIKIKDKKFFCHRCLLGSVSGYFQGMFERPFKEQTLIEIPISGPYGSEIFPSTMKKIISFIYSENTSIDYDVAQIYELLQAAEYLAVEGLKQKCIARLKSKLSGSNWFDTFRMALKLSISDLKRTCIVKFWDLYKTLDMSEVTFEALTSALDFAKKNEISCRDILSASILWINGSTTSRSKRLDKCMQYVNFQEMSYEYVRKNFFTERIVKDRPDIVKNIRTLMENRRILILGSGRFLNNFIVKYDPRTGQHTPCSNPLVLTSYGSNARASCGRKVYVVCDSRAIHVYDIVRDSWSLYPDMLQESRCGDAGAVVDQRLYIIGGDDGDLQYISSTETFDFAYKNSTELFDLGKVEELRYQTVPGIKPLKFARANHAVVTRRKKIYVIGGSTHSHNGSILSSCEIIDTESNECTEMTPLIVARSFLAAVLFQGHIIVIGGYDGSCKLSSVESYSFETEEWYPLPPMTTARLGHTACVFDGKVFVIGGYGTSSIEYFDPDTSTWKLHEKIYNEARFHYAAIPI